ncbi:hypothetical protein EDC01DRAFT_252965 [Geopyxis carbonaria]|nr:hypothetical protein EDC01DRAFT_252965 [Geopyxis carbonaria]
MMKTSAFHALLFVFFSSSVVSAQFGNLFEQMFSSGSGESGPSNGNHRQAGNVASDSSWYRTTYEGAACSNYLCLNTLACVDKPTHCPCVFPAQETKFEIDSDGLAICLSKSGKNSGSLTHRKVELARKGLL